VPRAPISSIWPGGFSDWELDLAADVVRRFLRTHARPDVEREDLVQDCLEHWLRQRRRYDPSRGASPKTFMRRVLERRLADIADHHTAAKRGSGERALSLDRPFGEGPTDLGDSLAAPVEDEDALLLRIAIEQAGKRLTARQRAIVEALWSGTPKAELARHLEVARSTLYAELARIESIYRDEGLNAFLD
jgi:RNA polymerase sigma factor (sigma-70 family)